MAAPKPADKSTGENPDVQTTTVVNGDSVAENKVVTPTTNTTTPPAAPKPADKNKKLYKCVKRIFYNNNLVKVGEELYLDSSGDIPSNFELVK